MLAPRIKPYVMTWIPARAPYQPFYAIYRPAHGHTLALAVTNAYRNFRGETFYRLMFEKDTDEPQGRFMQRLWDFIGGRLGMVVKTERGYHVYTHIAMTDPYEVLRLLRWTYYYGLVDEGYLKLAEKRVQQGIIRYGFVALRVAGKYAYHDLRIIYEDLGDDIWLRKVSEIIHTST